MSFPVLNFKLTPGWNQVLLALLRGETTIQAFPVRFGTGGFRLIGNKKVPLDSSIQASKNKMASGIGVDISNTNVIIEEGDNASFPFLQKTITTAALGVNNSNIILPITIGQNEFTAISFVNVSISNPEYFEIGIFAKISNNNIMIAYTTMAGLLKTNEFELNFQVVLKNG